MMFRILRLLLLVLLIGCKGNVVDRVIVDHVIEVYIDGSFCLGDKIAIRKAILEWGEALGGYLRFEVWDWNKEFDLQEKLDLAVRKKNIYVIMKVNSRYFEIIDADLEGKHYTVGLANYIGGNIIYLVRDRLDIKSLRLVTMHELGHLLGAQHEGKWLMSPYYNADRYMCIDSGTMRQVAGYWKIPYEKMKYCIRD